MSEEGEREGRGYGTILLKWGLIWLAIEISLMGPKNKVINQVRNGKTATIAYNSGHEYIGLSKDRFTVLAQSYNEPGTNNQVITELYLVRPSESGISSDGPDMVIRTGPGDARRVTKYKRWDEVIAELRQYNDRYPGNEAADKIEGLAEKLTDVRVDPTFRYEAKFHDVGQLVKMYNINESSRLLIGSQNVFTRLKAYVDYMVLDFEDKQRESR